LMSALPQSRSFSTRLTGAPESKASMSMEPACGARQPRQV
jgi:hypothetical protein